MRNSLASIGLVIMALAVLAQPACSSDSAVGLVAKAIPDKNRWGIAPDQLRSIVNPVGEGTFVYLEGPNAELRLLWIELQGRAYSLTELSSQLTGLPFLDQFQPSNGSAVDPWQLAGIDSSVEAIRLVYE